MLGYHAHFLRIFRVKQSNSFLCITTSNLRILTLKRKKRMKNSIYAIFTPNIRSGVWSRIVRIMRIMRNHRTGKRIFNHP